MTTLGLSADEVLTTTRAVRKRLDLERPVPAALVTECVDIAKQAPSPRNRQAWDFVMVTEPELIAEVAALWNRGLRDVFARAQRGEVRPGPSRTDFASDDIQRIMQSLDHLTGVLHRVPMLMIPTARVNDRSELDTVTGQSNVWGGVIPAVWSFMLAARERGLGTAWTTSHLLYEREVADLLGIPFDTVVQAALTPVAYTIGSSFKPAAREDSDAFLHWNGW